MENKVIYILKSFSKNDLKYFGDFLDSPYFNKSKKLVKLYKILINFHPTFRSKFLSDRSLSKRINPELEFNRSTLNSLFYDLYHCAEKYLLVKNIEENPIKAKEHQRDEFFRRKLYKLIDKNIDSAKRDLDSCHIINAEYYMNMVNIYTDICNLATITTSKSNNHQLESKFEKLLERGKYIMYFFVTEMIRQHENLLTFDKIYNTEKKVKLLSDIFNCIDFCELINILELNSGNNAISINLKLYLALFKTFSNSDIEKYFYEYKNLYFINLNHLSIDEKRFHIGRLIRYCMIKREANDSNNNYNTELFNIYELILKHQIFKSTVAKYISVELFRSILVHSLRMKKYKWSIEFIKKYSRYLDPKRKMNIYYFSRAEYYFQRKMYKDARHNLQKIVFEEFIYKLDYKNLMLITHFEMKEYDSALDLIDSYKHFLVNDKVLSLSAKKKYKKFINIVKSIIQFKISTIKTSNYFIEKEFDYDLPYNYWVREKIIELNIKIKKAI